MVEHVVKGFNRAVGCRSVITRIGIVRFHGIVLSTDVGNYCLGGDIFRVYDTSQVQTVDYVLKCNAVDFGDYLGIRYLLGV